MESVVLSESLDANETRVVRNLLDSAFNGEFTDDDWRHAVGGHHVLVLRDRGIVAHASVVPRRFWIGDDALRVGYVEAVATEPSAQGEGHGTTAMRAIGRIVNDRYGVGVLSTGAHRFYERLGWQRWLGPTWVRRPDGHSFRTPSDDDGVMVIAPDGGPPIDRRAAIACNHRSGDDW